MAKAMKMRAIPLVMLTALALLGACNRNNDCGVGQKTDGAAATVARKAGQARDAGSEIANKVGDRAKDISITAAINAELARDDRLSALNINVDTVDGRVVLPGTAPDAAARERATTLANAISGVLAVDNQLSVAGSPSN